MPAMADERRLVTVLFADVAGSTGLGETLDPEDLRALLARFFGIARETVSEHGGRVEKFIGDAVMAVFGLPASHGDDPVRACAAAIVLRDRVRYDPALGERLPIRIGLNSGEVVASRDADGAGDFLVTGDAVNVAARLQQGAEPWAIVVGERTAAAAADAFAFGPLGEEAARGRSAAVRAARLVGPARRARRRTSFVGRRSDVAQLELVAARVVEERRPYLVTIIAPPGTGKTRLVEEFLGELAREPQPPLVALAQCLPYGSQLTYWPLRALLAGLMEDGGDLLRPGAVDPADLHRRLVARLGDLGIATVEETARLLAATVGASGDETSDEAAVFAAWRRTLEAVASRRPLVLVIEDLHWSSDALLLLVELLLAPRADTPLLVLAIARPELLDRRPSWGGGRRNHVSLSLAPLPDRELATLVGGLLDGSAPDAVEAIVARSEGNPFFAGELARSVMERVGRDRSASSVAAALRELPDTVQGVVLARLDLLEPSSRRAVQVGAVLGRSFRPAALVALDPTLEPGLDRTLDDLVERDLVRADRGDELAFRHILIREVAYGTLPRAERARLHAAAGAWLEAEAGDRPDDVAELIALHYREAAGLRHLLDPAVVEGIRVRAVEWLRRAAVAASAVAANVEGARHLRAAIALADPEELPGLYEVLGTTRGYGTEAAEAFAEARRLAIELGRPATDRLRLVASEALIVTRWSGGSPPAPGSLSADELIAEGRRLLREVSDPRTRCLFLLAQAFNAWIDRDDGAAEGRASGEAALALALELDDAALQSAALDALAAQEVDASLHLEALRRSEERVSMGPRLPIFERLDARTMVAWTSTVLGRLDTAEAATREGLAELPPSRTSSFTLSLLAWSILHALMRGRWDEATRLAFQAEHAWEELERDAAGYAQHGFHAALFIARARRDEALIGRWLAIIEEIAGRFSGDRLPALNVRRHLAMASLDLTAIEREFVQTSETLKGRDDHAAYALTLAADRAYPFDPPPLRRLLERAEAADLGLVREAARRALGTATHDQVLLRAALAGYEAMGAGPFVARVQADLGLLAGDDALVAAGASTLADLGDVDQLARIEARRASR